ncbi:MAG TPA: ATP-binding protein [Gemmataceae bacterium]|nr:ATP-binding protein [Gemmataceae bacterium]
MAWNFQLFKPAVNNNVRERIEKHMGRNCLDAHIISHEIQPLEQVNLQLVLDKWLEQGGRPSNLFGYSLAQFTFEKSLAHFLRTPEQVAPVEREYAAVNANESLDCVTRGIFLLKFQEQSIVIMIQKPDHALSRRPKLELMGHNHQLAQSAFNQLIGEAKSCSVFKGKCLTLEKEHPFYEGIRVHFHSWAPVERDSIVLPETLMRVLERNVLGNLLHAEKLRQSGWASRHGVLFHGPPGTGKTLVVRYLAQACKDYTVILLTGKQLGTIRESCEIARLLAPSIVVVEDVDLIAEDRSTNKQPVFLCELMDEMDGLGAKTDCIFILTTNRPEMLEPALASRPGRVDQAIEFPLPDDQCRRRLFDLYGRRLDLQWVDLDRWIAQTDGASPAFIAELLRKAALFAAERGEEVPLKLRNTDIDQAVKELVLFGGDLTQKLLGYRRETG